MMWAGEDSNLRRRKPTGLQPVPFGRSGTDPMPATLSVAAVRPSEMGGAPARSAAVLGSLIGRRYCAVVASFDVVSVTDPQEVRNAVDQTAREIGTRYDFKDTGATIDHGDGTITLRANTDDRLTALRQVLEEKLVRRKVSLKALVYGDVEEASGATVRQVLTLVTGISSERAKELNKFIKALGIKGVQSQVQGDQLRVTSKKRNDLQAVIAELKAGDFDVALQFENFRD